MISVDSVKNMILEFQQMQNQINNKLGTTHHHSTPSNDEKLVILKQIAALNNILKQLCSYSEKYLTPSKSIFAWIISNTKGYAAIK
jgi:ABC-type Fe3+/spermidine/putrescine transport system ATPase subunit